MKTRRHVLKAGAAVAALSGIVSANLAVAATSVAYDWKTVPFGGGGFIDGFVYHPKEKGLLYARTDIGGAYRFDPAARSWIPVLDHLPKADGDLMGVLALAIDPNDANRLYAACGLYLGQWARDGAVLCSNDRGATWSKTEIGVKIGGNSGGRGTGERLQVDPNNSAVLFLGTSQDGLMKSSDQGKSFSKISFPSKHVSLVLIDPLSGAAGQGSKRLYAGAADGETGLYVSTDGGQSFKLEDGAPREVPQRAAMARDGTLYVTFAKGPGTWPTNPGNAETGGVWRRDAQTGKWKNISPMKPGGGNPNFGYSGLDIDPNRPGKIIVSTIERWGTKDDVYLSTDDGAKWKALGEVSRHDNSRYPWLKAYMNGEDKMGHWLADIKLDPFDGNTAIYGTGYGLWMTQNLNAAETGGVVNWDFTIENLEETATLEMRSPSGGATLLVAMGDVSGAAWDDVTKTPDVGLFKPTFETNRSVDYAELNPAIIARTADQAKTHGYWSVDGSASWKPFGSSPRKERDDKGNYLGAGTVAVSAKGTSFVWAPEKQAAFYSLDHGATWKESAGWPSYRDLVLEPVADRAIDGVFYVVDRTGQQILISIDHGQSFKPVVKGLHKIEGWHSVKLIAAHGNPLDMWQITPTGLLHFPGPEKPGKLIKAVTEAWLISLGKSAPGAAYHSLYLWGKVKDEEGFFRSDDQGETFVRINDNAHRFGGIRSIAADPLEYGVLYVAPHGRGVIMGRPKA